MLSVESNNLALSECKATYELHTFGNWTNNEAWQQILLVVLQNIMPELGQFVICSWINS